MPGDVNLSGPDPLMSAEMKSRRAAVIALTLAAALTPAVWASQEEVFEKAFSMEGVSRVSLENVNGQINAQAWDKPYVKVRAVKTASSAEILAETEIRVRKIGDEIKIETVTPRRRRLFGFLDLGTQQRQGRLRALGSRGGGRRASRLATAGSREAASRPTCPSIPSTDRSSCVT